MTTITTKSAEHDWPELFRQARHLLAEMLAYESCRCWRHDPLGGSCVKCRTREFLNATPAPPETPDDSVPDFAI